MNSKVRKITYLAVMVALDVVLSPILRIEGMAPMSSVINILAGVLMGPLYATIMAICCGIIRMMMMGIPPLALTGAVFGALLAGLGARWTHSIYGSIIGEIIGTGIVGSLLSYPVMVLFTGNKTDLYWLLYTPRFLGATLMGAVAAWLIWQQAKRISLFKDMIRIFNGKEYVIK
ncbi:energy coupling factor transporter S component ThiW [Weissella thailandensis]|uniref:Energy coupling factor transporter S component ThiW n=1 Tax=Weissella thailandensis TaxID=89061 RepID=A0ABX9I515_9LACO|nr:energy coupling factor transporter S component ThiW [Weissella thailandensis]NKY90812.1 energy coupling factor transporter S component ThiW [Weissella thailandensis]RDS59682.1 energy coupling factor transporter S component ThiW [Weissella thailandensis]GEP75594.1 energy coupling factor transporter S component ThiW [Weissella thailandensis]